MKSIKTQNGLPSTLNLIHAQNLVNQPTSNETLRQIKQKNHKIPQFMAAALKNKISSNKLQKNYRNNMNISPILQPQKSETFLKDSKQKNITSILSYKIHPNNLTINQKNSHSHKYKNQDLKGLQKFSSNYIKQNDNKKTRKNLIKPNYTNQQIPYNVPSQYYTVKNFENTRTENLIKQTRSKDHNQQTLRINKSPCQHKISKQKLQQFKSLQKIQNRLSLCEAYIQLSERKTNFLGMQVDYLMNKQIIKQSKKDRRNQFKKLEQNYLSERKIVFDEPLFKPLQEGVIIKSPKCGHKDKKQCKNEDIQNLKRRSTSKFHYRSNENKQSKLKDLIYFNQKNKPDKSPHFNSNKNNICVQVQEPLTSKQSVYRRQQQTQKNCSNFQYGKIRNSVNSNKFQEMKKRYSPKKKQQIYERNQEYLLNERQENRFDHNQRNRYQNNQRNQEQFQAQYIHSECVPYQELKKTISQNDSSQHSSSDKNFCQSKQFQISQFSNLKLNRTKSPFVIKQNEKSPKSHSIMKQKESQISYFKSVSDNHATTQKISLLQRSKIQKQTIEKQQIVIHSGESSQNFKQNQFTFVQEEINAKQLSDYYVIQSNFNSPKKLTQKPSLNDSKQNQLIQEFDQLVMAASRQRTPSKKKIIKEKIYRTSEQLQNLNSQKVKTSTKYP